MSIQVRLHICILGPPHLALNDQPIIIKRAQIRALLYCLAAQAEPVGRDHLTFLFWPDIEDAKARRHLTQLISHMRRALPDPTLLLTTKEHVQLDFSHVFSDAVEFERLADMGDISSLRQAFDLYQDMLLSGFSLPGHPEYELWLGSVRSRLEKRFLNTVELLLDEFAAQRAYTEVLALGERYLAIDELAEKVHRRLMEAYAATGKRSAALRQYEQFVLALERELGVGPLPETIAVYQAIVTGAQSARPTPDDEPIWTTLPSLDVPMVGRDKVIQLLATAFARVRDGQGQVVLVGGEAGIGKSRVVQEFAASLDGQVQILLGNCHTNSQSMPYQALVEALRPHIHKSDVVGNLDASWRAVSA